MAGNKRLYANPYDSGAWEDDYAIAKADADNCLNPIVFRSKDSSGNAVDLVILHYVGTGAITLVNFKGLPKRAIIFDHQANKYHVHTADPGTSTWVSSAAAV